MNKNLAAKVQRLLTGLWLLTFLPLMSSVAEAGTVSPEAKACFEWFSSLGFPDVKGCQFICVTEKWSDPKGKWPTQQNNKNAFLLTGNQDAFMVLNFELFRSFHQNPVPSATVRMEASYQPVNLEREASVFLKRIQNLKRDEDLFERLEERISKRAYTFVFAWACWRNGLDDEAEKLYQASKHLRYGSEEVDENNFQRVLEEEISHAVIWRAVIDFGDPAISRPKLLATFEKFIKNYPHSSHQERAKQTAEMLARMVAEDEAHAKVPSTNLNLLPVEERVRELIFQLRDQHGEQPGQPAECDIFSDWRSVTNSAAHQLVKIGYPAVPQLIAALEDSTFTRSVGYWRDFTFSHHVLTVGDCAVDILGRVTGKYFHVANHTAGYMSADKKVSETHAAAVAWWAEFQKKGERQTLVEGVEAGDENSASQANRLVGRYPEVAAAALAKGIHAATNGAAGEPFFTAEMCAARSANIRGQLIGIFQKFNPEAARTFLQNELHEGNDGSRASAAESLVQTNREAVIKKMIQEWQSSPDYKVEKDQGWTECARFLASVDSPDAIAAMGQNLEARPLNTRMAIIHNIGEGGTLYGEVQPISKRSAATGNAIELLLVTFLEDVGQQLGDSGPRMGRHYRDVRICDMAGYYLNQLWPDRYHFNLSGSPETRDQQRAECRKAWRLAHEFSD